ncbi:MAG TPA: hypothetical protein PL033_16100 [Candidatus Brocadiia bacterium]|nr:hypothetical protein [Candidatus Brocadiia bacterium]
MEFFMMRKGAILTRYLSGILILVIASVGSLVWVRRSGAPSGGQKGGEGDISMDAAAIMPAEDIGEKGLAKAVAAADVAGGHPEAERGATEDSVRLNLPKSFTVIRRDCFIVASDLEELETEYITENTLERCAKCLWKDYFEQKPGEKCIVYLFKDKESYKRNTKELFGFEPESPYGFYLRSKKSLIMDISTGTGTLVHELVHALRCADFPECPTWLDEGLASLHEQCIQRGDSLVGLVNWRLPGLKAALAAGKRIPLEKIIASSEAEFYGENSGLYYAEARYLCMFLQEKGLLKRYYREFKASRGDDPTGKTTLEKITGKGIGILDLEYMEWVGKLPVIGEEGR